MFKFGWCTAGAQLVQTPDSRIKFVVAEPKNNRSKQLFYFQLVTHH